MSVQGEAKRRVCRCDGRAHLHGEFVRRDGTRSDRYYLRWSQYSRVVRWIKDRVATW